MKGVRDAVGDFVWAPTQQEHGLDDVVTGGHGDPVALLDEGNGLLRSQGLGGVGVQFQERADNLLHQ